MVSFPGCYRPRSGGSNSAVTEAARNVARALEGVASDRPTVLVLGLEQVNDGCWAVLEEAGVRLDRVRTLPAL
jgi:hypothetical protein